MQAITQVCFGKRPIVFTARDPDTDVRDNREGCMVGDSTLLAGIRGALASLMSVAQPARWAKHPNVRRVSVKARLVRIRTTYPIFVEPSAASAGDDDGS